MAKTKEKVGSEKAWERDVNNLLKRQRAKRPYVIPMLYIEALADRIHSMNPTREMLTNMLKEFYEVTFDRGWQRRIADSVFFKNKQRKHFDKDWNKEKDRIDDHVHEKSNQKK